MEPHDEQEIGPDDCIIRRINPIHHVVEDKIRQCNRISSKAFRPSSGPNGGMSVDIEAKIRAANLDPAEYVITPVFTGAVQLRADAIRNLGLLIGYYPLPGSPYHGEVWGNPKPKPSRFERRQEKGLHQAAQWYVRLQGVKIR